KANPYPDLPDPLTLKNGQKVTIPELWWSKRRPEIVEDFDREVYGRVPKNVPAITWEVTHTTKTNNVDFAVVTKELLGHVDNSSYPAIKVDIQLTMTVPANANGSVPLMMEFGFSFGPFGFRPRGSSGTNGPAGTNSPPRGFFPGQGTGPTWQQQLL